MSDWKECRNYENCGCYCIYPDEFEAGLCGNCLEEHNEDERVAELERLRAELAASREREARMREALLTAHDHIEMDALEISHSKDAQVIRSAVIHALAEGAQLPVHQPVHQPVHDWEHTARLLDAALQELIVFVDDRWGDNECRPLENAKHALGLVKDEQ